jgi:Rieske Fe-S protein
VVEYKGKKIGVYKDESGKLFIVEPYCAHLGCELSWNNLEKTWDCPCHGSRYTYEGKVITEPTVKDLKKIE